ncbi:hypothetical protein [Streptomyces sp. NPDC096012]
MLSYQDVVTVKLGVLTDFAPRWAAAGLRPGQAWRGQAELQAGAITV